MNHQQKKRVKRERRKLRLKDRREQCKFIMNLGMSFGLFVELHRSSWSNPNWFKITKYLGFTIKGPPDHKILLEGNLKDVEDYLSHYMKLKVFL